MQLSARRLLRSVGAIIAIASIALPLAAPAATMQIVALGASNTAGKGSSVAWPALLEQMLRAKGYDAHVTNAGVSGDDLSRELARLGSATPPGTQLVILDKAYTNSVKRGVNISTTVAAIADQLSARGIKLIVIPNMHLWANNQLRADGIHITEQGHAAVAAHLLPLVIGALAKGGH